MEMKPAHFSRENLPANFQFIERKKNGKGREGRERLPRSHSDRVNYERFKPRFLRLSVGWLLPWLAPLSCLSAFRDRRINAYGVRGRRPYQRFGPPK